MSRIRPICLVTVTLVTQNLLFSSLAVHVKPSQVLIAAAALVAINEVALGRARLLLGWVTVCGRVSLNHLGI